MLLGEEVLSETDLFLISLILFVSLFTSCIICTMAEERNREEEISRKFQQVTAEKTTGINVILTEVKILKGQLRLAVERASSETKTTLGTAAVAETEVLAWPVGSYTPATAPIDGIIIESAILGAYVALKQTLNECDEAEKRIIALQKETGDETEDTESVSAMFDAVARANMNM